MIIPLPRVLDRNYINNLMANVVGEDLKPIHNEMKFDFSDLSFIQPSGITTLGNLFEWLVKNKTQTSILIPNEFGGSKCPIKYLMIRNSFLDLQVKNY